MEVTHEIFFWLKKAKILKSNYDETGMTLVLTEEDSLILELGLLGPLLKYLNLPNLPNDSEFNLSKTTSSRLYNWNLLIKPLENLGIFVGPDTKALIVAGDRAQVTEIVRAIVFVLEKGQKKKKNVNTADGGLLLNNIETNTSLDDAESILEFLILTFCKAFQISPKTSAGLLTQKCTYLTKITAKGLRGDFSPVVTWINLMQSHVRNAVKLVDYEESSLKMLLTCLQTGIFSSNFEIQKKTAEVLVDYWGNLKIFENTMWEWFSNQGDLIRICFNLLENNDPEVRPFFLVLYSFGKKNLAEIFVGKLKDYCNSPKDYMKTVQNLFVYMVKAPFSQHFFNQGIFDQWADIALRESETNAKDLENKAFCIGFLCDLWGSFPTFIEAKDELATNMLSVIKRATRENSKTLKILIYGHLFQMLFLFASNKNAFAPIIYKTLTFCLIENFYDEKIREFILTNMTKIFDEIESIPLGILIEPFIKQSLIGKNINFNVFDFKFFKFIAEHKRLIIKDCILLIDLLGKIVLSDFFYCGIAAKIFLIIAERFMDNFPVIEYLIKFSGIAIRIFFSEKKSENSAKQKNIFTNILSFLQKLIEISIPELNSEIRENFTQNLDEFKKIKNKQLIEIYKLLGVIQKPEENSGKNNSALIADVNINEDSQKIVSLYTIPKGRVMNDLEKVKQRRVERENKEKEEINKKNLSELLQKKKLRNQLEKRKIELGIKSKTEEENSEILLISENFEKEVLTQLTRISEELTEDQEMIEIILKKYSRAMKLLFSKYAGSTYQHKNNPISTFEKLQNTKENLSEPDFSKLLRENGISHSMITIEEIKSLYKFIALRYKSVAIHFESFPDLLYVTSSLIFTRNTFEMSQYPPALIFNAIFVVFRDSESHIVPKHIYDEPDPGYGDREIVKILNAKLEKNPDCALPESYKRYREPSLTVTFSVKNCEGAQKFVIEILDSILEKSLGIHLLMPIVEVEFKTRAKGIIVAEERKYLGKIESNPNFSKLSPHTKLAVIGLSNVAEETAIECGKVLDDILYSVSKNSLSLISKLPKPLKSIHNKYLNDKLAQEIAKNNEIEKAETRRKIRMQMIENEINRLREEKEYKSYLEEQEKKKESQKIKILEKKIKEKRDKEKLEIEERILEYKLEKYEKEIKNNSGGNKKNMWRIGKVRVNNSIDMMRGKSSEKEIFNANSSRHKSRSIPRLSQGFAK